MKLFKKKEHISNKIVSTRYCVCQIKAKIKVKPHVLVSFYSCQKWQFDNVLLEGMIHLGN